MVIGDCCRIYVDNKEVFVCKKNAKIPRKSYNQNARNDYCIRSDLLRRDNGLIENCRL